MTMGTDILGTVFLIVTSTKALKALGKEGSRTAGNRDIKKASRGRDDGAVVTNSHDEGLVSGDCIFI